MKKIALFLVVNFLVLASMTIASQFVSGNSSHPGAVHFILLAVSWGLIGAVLSLIATPIIARMAYKIELLEASGPGGWVVNEVALLCQIAKVPVPNVGIYQSSDINAFVVGATRRDSLLALSTGLLETLNREQLRAVLAHEISHLNRMDMAKLAMVQGFVNGIVLVLARILTIGISGSLEIDPVNVGLTIVFELALGFVGMLGVCWYSRMKEYGADAGGARIVGRTSMISAIEYLYGLDKGSRVTAFLESIQSGPKQAIKNTGILSTHPSLDARVKNLKQA